ncbi:MAG: hypothetical protein KAZ87_10155 [Spirochaetes bacterium]|nr:hypothetical protein [Spirochaetota bacterium]
MTNNSENVCSDNHRIWVYGKGWKKVDELCIGDELSSKNGKIAVSFVSIKRGDSKVFYNIEVEESGNYLIGKDEIMVVDRWPVTIIHERLHEEE